MKKEIREADPKRGIIQVTIADERWYLKQQPNPVTDIPEYIGVPSVTWITQSYPKGIAYFKWLADKGWDESEAIKTAAGEKGSKVHLAIEAILRGEEVRIDSCFMNKNTGKEEELTLEESDCILSFVRWFNEAKPEVIASERTVFSTEHGYAGTIDFIAKIGEEYWIIDFKTSQQVWPSHELQLAAYKNALRYKENCPEAIMHIAPSEMKLAVLQVGYRKNKNGYKWNEIEDRFNLFLAAKEIWQYEHSGEQPTKKDYPVVLSPKKEKTKTALPDDAIAIIKEARKREIKGRAKLNK